MIQTHIVPITCPSCGAKISIPEGSNRITCDYCGNESIIQMTVQAVTPPAAKPVIRPRIPTPAAVQIIKDGESARIVQRWFSVKYIPMAFFAIAWDAFLIFWYGMAFRSHAPWIMVVFPIAHLAVGVGISYSTLAGFINHTTLELTQDELSIYFDPLPWLGEKTIKTSEIKQLYCKQSVTHGENSTTYSYQLYAVTQDNKQVKLLSNVDSPDVAQFFEQQLETWLRISDAPVRGELEK